MASEEAIQVVHVVIVEDGLGTLMMFGSVEPSEPHAHAFNSGNLYIYYPVDEYSRMVVQHVHTST